MIRHNPKDIGEIYERIPTWDNGTWKYTSFDSREEFALELETNYFKEPGTYELDDTVYEFRKQALIFQKRGYYCDYDDGDLGFNDYWDFEKLKSRKGVFYHNHGKSWYLPREYYFWINFLEITDKVKKSRQFSNIWDTQMWMALYEKIAELRYKHGVILKKRQFGSSFYHVARQVNILWFEDSAVLKMGASLDVYLTGTNGSWKFAQMYRTFLNKNTAWKRAMAGGVGGWTQKQEVNENGTTYDIGNNSTYQGLSFHQSDTNGVGGLTTEFFYEEAGIAPRMDKTLEFLLPAMEAGDITTGYFVAAGTVGDLAQCKPLRKFIYKPEQNGFYGIRNKWANNKGSIMITGLFVPEQYSMLPFIDKYGNSLVDEAVERLDELYEKWEKDLDVDVCQIRKSQRPKTLEIAFSAKGESHFPIGLITGQKLKIEDGEYPYEVLDLEEGIDGKILVSKSNKAPIRTFPVDKKMVDKSGAIEVWERPDCNGSEIVPEWGIYYASVDPVFEGKTISSDSLCTINVYKNPIQVTRYDEHGKATTFIDGDKVVCSWAGRFDDINDTHKRLELIIRWYNAWTIVEVNVSLFVVHMIHWKLQKYLVPKSEMIFLKEHGHNAGTFQEYGWKNTGDMFHKTLLPYLIAYVKEKIDFDTDVNGNITNVMYGIERIPDIMALEEMLQYEVGLNVDRLISLAALIAFVKLQNANRGYKKRIESDEYDNFDNSDKMSKLPIRSPYRHMGKPTSNKMLKPQRSPFRNLK
jgi:hypothetical protein